MKVLKYESISNLTSAVFQENVHKKFISTHSSERRARATNTHPVPPALQMFAGREH